MEPHNSFIETVKNILDVAAFGTAFATVAKMLPPLAALFSILWISFQFYHSEPMKRWRAGRKVRDEQL
ncbi:hypothetical protein ACO0LG_08720 [Undibacterium sp. Ji42W]|uniref:hypothetical protein n=1 Tax=Undibacterium sp. Ji42W TaxID=3413039 RepID=UPI003BF12D68